MRTTESDHQLFDSRAMESATFRWKHFDTWFLRNGKWQIVASETMRYYGDPAEGKADTAKFSQYVGTYELAPGVTASVTAESGMDFLLVLSSFPHFCRCSTAIQAAFCVCKGGRMILYGTTTTCIHVSDLRQAFGSLRD